MFLLKNFWILDGKKLELLENSDLFWAMRGGGAGPYGVVTAMTIKMHKPLDDCAVKCYHVTNVILVENFFTDQGEMMKEFSKEILIWTEKASKVRPI